MGDFKGFMGQNYRLLLQELPLIHTVMEMLLIQIFTNLQEPTLTAMCKVEAVLLKSIRQKQFSDLVLVLLLVPNISSCQKYRLVASLDGISE